MGFQPLIFNGFLVGQTGGGGGGGGTVTSVGLSLPGIFTVSGSPVTTSGTLTGTLVSQSANTFFAGPNGSSGVPTFRLIVPTDVPTLNQNTTGTAANITATSNSTLVTLNSLSLPYSQITGAPTFANTNLSNLTSPTSINQNLLSSSPNTFEIGSLSNYWTSVYADSLNVVSGVLRLYDQAGTTPTGTIAGDDPNNIPDGNNGLGLTLRATLTVSTALENSAAFVTANDSSSNSNATGGLYLETGNKTGGTGNSGGILLRIGTSSGGTRGKIQFQDGSQGTSGYIWTSTDTNGSGDWQAAPATGVTSVALADSTGLFNITGSPVTSTGTLTLSSFQSQTANTFLAAPNGSSGSPTFRTIVSSDIPSLSYANQTLSNLTSPTAVNQNLLPGSANTFNIGSTSESWASTFSNQFLAYSSSAGTTVANLNAGGSTPSGTGTAASLVFQSISNPSGIWTASSGASQDLRIETGNASAGNSGGIKLTVGTATGTRGGIQFVDGTQGTAGYIWTSRDTAGTGNWAIAPTSGINQLTGDVTAGPGSGSQAATLVTVNSNVGSFGSSTSIPSFTVNAKGLITAASGNVVIAPAGTLSGTTLNSTVVTSSLTSLGAQTQALNMNSHLINNVTDPSSAQDAATKHYVDNAVAGINPAVAVQAATTSAANTSSYTYNNGVSGIGATFTGATNTAVVIDGYTFTTLGQRLLVKNDTQSPSGAFNGIYYVTQLQTSLLPPILTRALDYDQPSDINNTGAIPVINGTVNGTTQWVITSQVNTIGTDPLTYAQFSGNPANYLLSANNLSDVASKSTSFNNISPITTTGDLIYSASGAINSRLAIGSTGQVLTVNGSGVPAWMAAPGTVSSFFASSQITTKSTAVTSGSYTTFSNSPAFTFTPTISGTYKIYGSFPLYCSTTGEVSNARIFNTSGSGTLLYQSDSTQVGYAGGTGGAGSATSIYCQSVYTLTAGTSYQFDVQGMSPNGGNIYLDVTDFSLTGCYIFAELEVVGTASQPTGNYFSGGMTNASSWSTTSTSFADGSNTNGNTLTAHGTPTITVTAAASNVAGITFTPPSSTAVYLITATSGLNNNTVSASARLTDGTTTISTVAYAPTASNSVAPITLTGTYSPGTTSPVTVKIQIATSNASNSTQLEVAGALVSSIEWTVVRIV